MRAAPATYGTTLASAILRPCWEVTSWLGAAYLGKVDVKSGLITETAADAVTGRLELTVANVPRWRPSSPTAPLGWFGQQLHARAGWMDATGRPLVWFDLGRFRVRYPAPAVDVLTVTADSLQQLVVNARFTVATSFPKATYAARVRALLKSVLPVQIDSALTDRAVKKQTYDQDRMGALSDILTAWPAQLEVSSAGVARVVKPWESRPTVVVATYADGPGGTVVDVAPTSGDDTMMPNAVVASSEPDDGKKVITEAAYLRSGPLAWGGPYGYVPDFYSSPLLTTRAQCQQAAQSRLAKLQRSVQMVEVTLVDDPRVELGDVVRVRSKRRSTDVTGRVVVCQHGLTPVERSQVTWTLSVLSGVVDGVRV